MNPTLLDVVVLERDLPSHGPRRGDLGAVVGPPSRHAPDRPRRAASMAESLPPSHLAHKPLPSSLRSDECTACPESAFTIPGTGVHLGRNTHERLTGCRLTLAVRWFMATTTVSSKGQIVIPRHLREKHRLISGVRLQITETDEGLVLSPIQRSRAAARESGWRALRGSAKGTDALRQHLEEHRREAKR